MTNFELGDETRYYLERNYIFATVCKSFHYYIVLNCYGSVEIGVNKIMNYVEQSCCCSCFSSLVTSIIKFSLSFFVSFFDITIEIFLRS